MARAARARRLGPGGANSGDDPLTDPGLPPPPPPAAYEPAPLVAGVGTEGSIVVELSRHDGQYRVTAHVPPDTARRRAARYEGIPTTAIEVWNAACVAAGVRLAMPRFDMPPSPDDDPNRDWSFLAT